MNGTHDRAHQGPVTGFALGAVCGVAGLLLFAWAVICHVDRGLR